MKNFATLLQAKRELPITSWKKFFPKRLSAMTLLMNFLHGLISPDPNRRFASAEAAVHVDTAAAAFHRQLILVGHGNRI